MWTCEGANMAKRGVGESWIGDSGATESMTPDAAVFENYEVAPPGRTVELGDGTLLPVAGYGDLRLQVEQNRAVARRTSSRSGSRSMYRV